MYEHPEVAFRDCQFCLKVLHDADGKPEEKRGSTPEKRVYYERDSTCPADCRTPKGCPKGTAENPIELSESNRRAIEHYRECVAVGSFPNDDIVRRNAAIIRRIDDDMKARKEMSRQNQLDLMFLSNGRRDR